jgi:hypothetical protein
MPMIARGVVAFSLRFAGSEITTAVVRFRTMNSKYAHQEFS